MTTSPCSAIVLAGGRATRLGGIDKALVSFAGRPLIAHVLERLRPQVDDIVINCNRNEEVLGSFGYPLVRDQPLDYPGSEERYECVASKGETGEELAFTEVNAGFKPVFDTAPGARSSFSPPCYSGPLAGIISALPVCRHELVLVTPCDTPFLPADLCHRLSVLMARDIDLVIAHDGERLQPLFMLLRRHLLDSLREYLGQSNHKVEYWCLAQKLAIARFNDKSAFINLNTPEELKAAENTGG